jgi:hypothetical protein
MSTRTSFRAQAGDRTPLGSAPMGVPFESRGRVSQATT